jgi:hypothetical protein
MKVRALRTILSSSSDNSALRLVIKSFELCKGAEEFKKFKVGFGGLSLTGD